MQGECMGLDTLTVEKTGSMMHVAPVLAVAEEGAWH